MLKPVLHRQAKSEAQMGQFLSKIRCGVALRGPLPGTFKQYLIQRWSHLHSTFLKICALY